MSDGAGSADGDGLADVADFSLRAATGWSGSGTDDVNARRGNEWTHANHREKIGDRLVEVTRASQ